VGQKYNAQDEISANTRPLIFKCEIPIVFYKFNIYTIHIKQDH